MEGDTHALAQELVDASNRRKGIIDTLLESADSAEGTSQSDNAYALIADLGTFMEAHAAVVTDATLLDKAMACITKRPHSTF